MSGRLPGKRLQSPGFTKQAELRSDLQKVVRPLKYKTVYSPVLSKHMSNISMTFTTQLLLFRGAILNLAWQSLLSFVLGIGHVRSSEISKGQTRLFVPYFRINSKQECRIELKF